ncbi:MAG TPA: hypothetical protein VIW92_03555 [Thermoanaerobaculia bacterium]
MAKRTDVGGGRGSATNTPTTPDLPTSNTGNDALGLNPSDTLGSSLGTAGASGSLGDTGSLNSGTTLGGTSFNPGTNVGTDVNRPLMEGQGLGDQNQQGGMAQQAKDQAKGLANEAKDQVKQVAGQARDHVQELVGQQKDQAANKLGSLAGALREAANKLNEGEQSGDFGRYADQAAQQVDKLSTYLRDNDLRGFVRDTENFARRRPDLFLGTTFLAGLMVARFLKASSTNQDTGYDGYDGRDWQRTLRTTGGYGTADYGTSGYGTGRSTYGTGTSSYGSSYGSAGTTGATGTGTTGTSYGAGTEDRSSYTPERRDLDEGIANTGTKPLNDPVGR